MKLQTKLLLILIFVFFISFFTIEFIHYQRTKGETLRELKHDARNIRAILMAVRRVYHHQYLDSEVALTDKTIGFLPAHALSRISEDFSNWSNKGLSFNNVSDRPRNPRNAADTQEKEAMVYFRNNPTEKERFTSFKTGEGDLFYHYTAPIWVEKYCLKCHGKREEAPIAIRTRYVSSFDYKVGDLRGVMSIKLPASHMQAHIWANFTKDIWIHFASFLGIFLLFSLLLRRYVTAPLTRLTKGLKTVAEGNYDLPIEGLTGEMSILGATFNQMSFNLNNRENELKHLNKTLEQRVVNRTEELQLALKEKDVLLKEIHHRVKNNMQIVSSLLKLQCENLKDERLIDILQESQNRIKSMALIHEELYQSKDFAKIDFSVYVRALTGRLIKSYIVDPNSILLDIVVDNVFLGVDVAIPCGLIINELFSNSLKYAFPALTVKSEQGLENNSQKVPNESKGEICINFRSENNKYTLIFSDNGVGLPEDLDFRNTKTLGLDLVNLLTDQIDGIIELDRSKGTAFKIVFEV